MNLSKVKFKPNTINQEIDRVFETIGEMSFFKRNGYRVFLPKVSRKLMDKIKGCEVLSVSDKKEIINQIKEEYKNPTKEDKILNIKNYWIKNIEQKFFDNIVDLLKIKSLKEYEVYLTQYGCGGSYWPPDKVIVNINLMRVYTIAHEIVHLMIEYLIRKHKISHWHKERMVDLYLSKIFNDYGLQNIKKIPGIKKIDDIFEKKYKLGAENLIKSIK